MGDSNTKLLQVVSLQKLFLNSIGAQISDLIKFNNSKFVHISSLEIFGSIMIYMFQGIHRLQICSNWIYRTKVMNFMVFISHFAILFFTSKLCAVTLWFLHINVFYTLQGFHVYQICNFWPSSYFLMNFRIGYRNRDLNLNLKFRFDWALTANYDMDS
jgi:hypothetical protein